MLAADSGFRPSFLGHVLVEVLLDWTLAEDNPGGLDSYYRALESVDPPAVQEAVNRMSARGTDRLAPMIFLFCRERILWDYGQDDKLLVEDESGHAPRRLSPTAGGGAGVVSCRPAVGPPPPA